jgi:hypothetical protein
MRQIPSLKKRQHLLGDIRDRVCALRGTVSETPKTGNHAIGDLTEDAYNEKNRAGILAFSRRETQFPPELEVLREFEQRREMGGHIPTPFMTRSDVCIRLGSEAERAATLGEGKSCETKPPVNVL